MTPAQVNDRFITRNASHKLYHCDILSLSNAQQRCASVTAPRRKVTKLLFAYPSICPSVYLGICSFLVDVANHANNDLAFAVAA